MLQPVRQQCVEKLQAAENAVHQKKRETGKACPAQWNMRLGGGGPEAAGGEEAEEMRRPDIFMRYRRRPSSGKREAGGGDALQNYRKELSGADAEAEDKRDGL